MTQQDANKARDSNFVVDDHYKKNEVKLLPYTKPNDSDGLISIL